jgi:hypothetical protein
MQEIKSVNISFTEKLKMNYLLTLENTGLKNTDIQRKHRKKKFKNLEHFKNLIKKV